MENFLTLGGHNTYLHINSGIMKTNKNNGKKHLPQNLLKLERNYNLG